MSMRMTPMSRIHEQYFTIIGPPESRWKLAKTPTSS